MKKNLIINVSNSVNWDSEDKDKCVSFFRSNLKDYNVFCLFTDDSKTTFHVLEYPKLINQLKNITLYIKYLWR